MFDKIRVTAVRLACVASVVLAFAPTFASAVPIKWTLENATFDDGGRLSGSFVYDSDTGVVGERALSVAGGSLSVFPVLTYNNANSVETYSPFGNPQPSLVMQLNTSNRQLRITPDSELGNSGGIVQINLDTAQGGSGSAECFNCGPARRIVTGRLLGQQIGGRFVINSGIAGNWYDPAQNGHGFQFEILPNNIATVFWFTFDDAGNQVWINGAGTIDGDHVIMQAGRVLNGHFPPNFNPDAVERRAWGTLSFLFTDCNHGTVNWTSTDPAFTASGQMSLTRLTSLSGVSCP